MNLLRVSNIKLGTVNCKNTDFTYMYIVYQSHFTNCKRIIFVW